MNLKLDYRNMSHSRAEMNADNNTMEGYAALFDTKAKIWDFEEVIARGAFKKSIDNRDVRALFNHDTGEVLGRTKSGTLKIWEDEKGLAFSCVLPDTSRARDLKESIKRGDVNQCSFGFSISGEKWDKQNNLRTITEADLYEISIVTFPAYEQTSVYLRTIYSMFGNKPDIVEKIIQIPIEELEKWLVERNQQKPVENNRDEEAIQRGIWELKKRYWGLL